MSFAWPVMLLSLLTLPLIAAMYQRAWERRRQIALRFGGFGLAQRTGRGRHLPAALFLAGLALLALAMARPQAEIGVPRLEGTLILVFDVSGSMAADDIKPSRMEAAKAAARVFVERQPSTVMIGVVSFSDSGFVVQRPTGDKDAILATIARLAPQRATSLANGIMIALDVIAAGEESTAPAEEPATPAPLPATAYASEIVVLISDGENTVSPDPLTAAQLAAERGVRVYTLGVGTPAGAVLTIDGFNIHTALDETTLRQIADLTGGAYYNAQTEEDFESIYSSITPQFVIKPEKMEVTSLFAGLSIAILLAGGALSLLWFGRLP